MFSQTDEEQYILEYFGDKKGTFLDIGAFDGITYSNTHRLALNGWKGVCIEPSPRVFEKLKNLYISNPNIVVLEYALTYYDGSIQFWDNDEAYASSIKEHVDKWSETDNQKFELIEVPCISWETFYKKYPKKYDFISIDTEGLDWQILNQIDLAETGTTLVCVETTYNDKKIYQYLSKFGFTPIYTNQENLLMGVI